MRTPIEIAREAHAQLAERNDAPGTAAAYRAGKYDEGGTMPVALRAAEIALEQAAKITEGHADDRPHRDGIGFNDGYIAACRGASEAIRASSKASAEG